MHASDGVEGAIEPRPRYCNFYVCKKQCCEGLCYNHHPFSDAPAVSMKEILACICGGECSKEYCHNERCSCFWKLQKEIVNLRERMASASSRHKKKSENYQAEINILRASTPDTKVCFSEEVLRNFGHHFQNLRRMENSIRDDFVMQIRRFEQSADQKQKSLDKLMTENNILQKKITKLEAELRTRNCNVADKVEATRKASRLR
tara:strand:- start:1264 stop:1875 length:612 start_codon:yes stop_codon:yes gene_type:complete